MHVTRRGVLISAGVGLASLVGTRTSIAQMAFSANRDRKHDTLVVLFLRGGADCMSLFVPFAEDAYHRERPNLAFSPSKSLRLDDRFALNPMLAPLMPAHKEGKLAVVHAVGSDDKTRSHFEAMSAMERGLANDGAGPTNGWLARYLSVTEAEGDSPLRAVALSSVMPNSLRGATHAVAMETIDEFKLETFGVDSNQAFKSLTGLYAMHGDEVAQAGQDTLSVLDTLRKLDKSAEKTLNEAKYPNTDLGESLRQTAMLIRADVGLEVAAMDMGGWDTHVAQGTTGGLIAGLVTNLGASVSAFAQDLGERMNSVTLVVMTEFGRRLRENNGFGTDHGRAGAMVVLGGGVRGGRVVAKWPGLEASQLDDVGDLRVTTDYRDVLSEVLSRRMGVQKPNEVFEGYTPKPVGLFG